MATRLKTTHFAFPALASMTNNTLTALTQITVYVPESSPVFRSVTATATMDDITTATGPTITTKTMELRLGAAAYTTITNSTSTASGENISLWMLQDFTAHFNTNWSGTSMTCDVRLLVNQTAGTTPGMVNVCVTLDVTYEYDDTSTTHIKTVYIPLDAPAGALTSTPTTYDTIPAIGYYLAEGSKTFRNTAVVICGNEARNTLTTDHTLSIGVGAASTTSATYVGALASDRFFRYVWELSASWPSTTASQTFQLSDTVGRNNHLQAYLAVTYEFKANAAATTLTAGVNNSATTFSVANGSAFGTAPFVAVVDNEQVLVTSIASNDWTVTRAYNGTTGASHSNGAAVNPCATNSIQPMSDGNAYSMGGTTSSDYQRINTRFYIEEPGPITGGKIAFYAHWGSSVALTGLNMRVGTGSFVTYTDAALVFSGGNGAMCRNDSAFSLVRGINSLTFDSYRSNTTTSDQGAGLTGYWCITYVSAKSAAGHGAHNHTVRRNIYSFGTASFTNTWAKIFSSAGPEIPETDYYISNCGVSASCLAASQVGNLVWQAERLAGEGGIKWDTIVSMHYPGENMGVYLGYADASKLFKRWPGDNGFGRLDVETNRRHRNFITTTLGGWQNVAYWITYHTCGPFTVSDNVTGSDGGTVTIGLYRSSDGELLKSTTRAGNGAYSFNWWDNTENVFTACTDATGNTARSKDGLATGSP